MFAHILCKENAFLTLASTYSPANLERLANSKICVQEMFIGKFISVFYNSIQCVYIDVHEWIIEFYKKKF